MENAGEGATDLAACSVVLVRPRIAANIGAAARVMRNFGLERLFLVAPAADATDERAIRLATHSEDILHRARIVADLREALADCTVAVATSARDGGLFRKQSVGTPREVLPHVAETLPAPAALVFGPETSGLTNAEIARCHYLIRIPTAEAHPALNLAQAVAICLYELRVAYLQKRNSFQREEPADFAEQERMFDRLRGALERIHFLYGPKADPLFHAVRHLIGRAGPTPAEVKVLHGLARQIEWFANHGGKESS